MVIRLQSIPLRILIPHIFVFLWVVFLGVTIWSHSIHSIQPPLYDPIGYFQKGLNFWQGIIDSNWVNPFNIEPTSRPPGTILLSAPCGYATDFHGFYFRSVFFPIVCIVVAVYISVGWFRVLESRWGVASIALLFSTLPMFYHFEWVSGVASPVRFGLVDNFQAGIAAVATSAFIYSFMKTSGRWLLVGVLMASLTLLIKPSGGAVVALLCVFWVICVFLKWLNFKRNPRQSPESLKKLQRYLILGSIQLFVVSVGAFILCFKSHYLSQEHFLFAKQALVIMKEVLAINFSQIPPLLHTSMGEFIFLWIIGVVILFSLHCFRFGGLHKRSVFTMSGILILAFTFWIAGIFYWLVVQMGGSQIRYFYPFFLMGLICLVPVTVYLWSKSKKWVQFGMLLICFLPASNMAALLVQTNPSFVWQKATGISISIGKHDAVVKQAYDFLGIVRQKNVNTRVYSFATGLTEIIFENVGMYEGVANPDCSTYDISRPQDWVRGFVVRVDDLLSSAYICIEPVKEDEIQAAMKLEQISSFDAENRIFHAWLTTLTEKEGVEIISDESVRLLKISDIKLFERQIEYFISLHFWRPEFEAANYRRWWKPSEVSSYLTNSKMVAKEIDFGDLYRLHVMTLSRIGKKIKIEFWWEALNNDDKSRERKMFFHFIDSDAKIRLQQYISLGGYNPPSQQQWRYGSIEFDASIDKEITAFAFGVWHPDAKVGILKADKGVRDWDDHRVIVPLEKVMTHNEMESR